MSIANTISIAMSINTSVFFINNHLYINKLTVKKFGKTVNFYKLIRLYCIFIVLNPQACHIVKYLIIIY